MQLEAAWALCNVASGTSQQCGEVVAAGALPAVLPLLSSPRPELREQVIRRGVRYHGVCCHEWGVLPWLIPWDVLPWLIPWGGAAVSADRAETHSYRVLNTMVPTRLRTHTGGMAARQHRW